MKAYRSWLLYFLLKSAPSELVPTCIEYISDILSFIDYTLNKYKKASGYSFHQNQLYYGLFEENIKYDLFELEQQNLIMRQSPIQISKKDDKYITNKLTQIYGEEALEDIGKICIQIKSIEYKKLPCLSTTAFIIDKSLITNDEPEYLLHVIRSLKLKDEDIRKNLLILNEMPFYEDMIKKIKEILKIIG